MKQDIKIWLICMVLFISLIVTFVGLQGRNQVGVTRLQFFPVSNSITPPAEIFLWLGE